MIRTGRKINACRIWNTPLTASPKIRKGRSRIQTNGYNISARSASGQQRKSRINHRIKPTIISPEVFFQYSYEPVLAMFRSVQCSYGSRHESGMFYAAILADELPSVCSRDGFCLKGLIFLHWIAFYPARVKIAIFV